MTFVSTILFAISFISFGASAFVFLGYKTVKHGRPLILLFLVDLSLLLQPTIRYLSTSSVVGPLFASIVRVMFFAIFVILLMSDHLIRIMMKLFVGKHPTGRYYSITSAMDPQLHMFDSYIPTAKYLENSDLFNQRRNSQVAKSGESNSSLTATKKPDYSLSLAYNLSIASKLVYEDIEVVKYELRKSGFDVDRTFRPIAYKNICAFIVEKENYIMLVFRGTNPLNMQNYITNATYKMTQIETAHKKPMGKVHQGFWEAMGEYKKDTVETSEIAENVLRIELDNASIYCTVVSALQATVKIVRFLSWNLFHHVKEPIDSTWIGPQVDVRSKSMYTQAEQYILNLAQSQVPQSREKKLFITGHSLGGAMGTIFLGKMLQSNSPLLNFFGGLYTFGQPKIGDKVFSRAFNAEMTSRIFHHVYNNDIIPRVPNFSDYHTPPGTLVFIGSDYSIALYPPNPYTNSPVSVRSISFIQLSGLLNRHVIRRTMQENQVRILFRVFFPFFLNDHFPSDYCDSIRNGKISHVFIPNGGTKTEYSEPNTLKKCNIVNVQE
ncbi:Alpha/Beta hydrolase protein [Sporodiniella umbellata]|nr:Alpha/Beta hydrolase protein [Sporodiniella umbellata]